MKYSKNNLVMFAIIIAVSVILIYIFKFEDTFADKSQNLPSKNIVNDTKNLTPDIKECVDNICPKLEHYSVQNNTQLPYYSFNTESKDPRAIIIYMHGAGGGYEQGMQNNNYKESFKRLKETVLDLSYLYFTPEVSTLSPEGYDDLRIFVAFIKNKYPNRPIYLAGASAGGRFAASYIKDLHNDIDGAILIGPVVDDRWGIILAVGTLKRIPVYIIAGSKDQVVPIKTIELLKDVLNRMHFPVKLDILDGGDHNAPVEEINWPNAIDFLVKNQTYL